MDEFIDALMNLIEVKTERDKAFADCDSSWGYYGFHEDEKLAEAQERFSKAFKAMVKKEGAL